MIGRGPRGAETWLLSLPPTRRQTRWVMAIALCQVAALALLAPFASIPLAEINGFVPVVGGVIFVTDLVTAVLLFSQFATHLRRALLILACGYLLSALMIIPYTLTFPGAFSPTGLLGAGLQTAAWFYWFWHLPFALALLGYGLIRDKKSTSGPVQASSLAVIVRSVALVLALASGLTLLATTGHDYLPVLYADSIVRVRPLPTQGVAPITTLVCVSALAALWLRRRSLLDQWLMVVALAAILEIGLGVLLSQRRFDLGFYAGRGFSLLTSTIVLVILLVQTMRLYANLRELNETLEQRVQAETRERLRKEAEIRHLVDANILGICTWSIDGAIVSANEEFLRMLQYSQDDVASGRLRWIDLTPPEWRKQAEDAVAELRSTGAFRPMEKEYFSKDGSRVPVLIGGALFEEDGNDGVAFVLDLTERKRAEEALRKSEYQLRQIIDAVPGLIWSAGPDGEATYVSRRLLEYSGSQLEDNLKPHGWEVFVHPDDLAAFTKDYYQAIQTGTPYRGVLRLRCADAAFRWHDVLIEPLRDQQGRIIQWYGLSINVDEAKKIEGALRESEAKFRAAIDGIAGLVAIMAPSGELESVNRPIIEYFGRSVEELKNWGTGDAVHPEDLPRVLESFRTSFAAGTPFHQEQRLRRFDGEYRWFENRGAPIRDETGRITRWYCLLTDIEDRTQALARLQQMQSDFAHMNRVSLMGELAASLSHEIAQPIGSARNNARAAQNFLERQPQDMGEVREALSCVIGDADRAGAIIDRIREQIKKAPPRKECFDLNAAIEEVIVLAQSVTLRNGVSVQTRLAEGLLPPLGDRVQVQQVLLNLVLNAAEAMSSVEEGARELVISTEHHLAGALVAVRDSGPGIGPAHLDRVFDAFYTTKSRGTGMGLSICRSIIHAHGGKLWAEANDPRGAAFQFTLPDAERELTAAPQASRPA
ncbi:PAS domain S-box-containing protein [Bradyrhizobium niftali]